MPKKTKKGSQHRQATIDSYFGYGLDWKGERADGKKLKKNERIVVDKEATKQRTWDDIERGDHAIRTKIITVNPAPVNSEYSEVFPYWVEKSSTKGVQAGMYRNTARGSQNPESENKKNKGQEVQVVWFPPVPAPNQGPGFSSIQRLSL